MLPSEWWPKLIDEPRIETQIVEYKGAEPRESNFKGIVRAALAMSNTANGGFIVIGVDEDNGVFIPTGLSEELEKSYKLQTLGHSIMSHGSQGMEVKVHRETYQEKIFIALQVSPFDEYPIICTEGIKPNEKGGVKEGVTYYRNSKCEDKPASEVEHRRIMERVVRLGIERWGVLANVGTNKNSRSNYESEIEGLL